MADLFDFEIRLVNENTSEITSVNVSKKTKELYDVLSESIQNKDESIARYLDTFLLHFERDVFKNAYFNGSMGGPLIKLR